MFKVEVYKGDSLVSSIECNSNKAIIGKGESANVRLKGWTVAEQHASLYVCDEGVHVLDTQPNRTGISVNGKKVREYGPISLDDTISIGSYLIKVDSALLDELSIEYDSNQQTVEYVASSESQSSEPSDVVEMVARKKSDTRSDKKPEKDKVWRERLHEDLLERMDLRRVNIKDMSDEEVLEITKKILEELVEEYEDIPSEIKKPHLVKLVLDEAIGLGPLEDLLSDDSISEIMVNCADEIYYEKEGIIQKSDISFTNDRAVTYAIERIVSPLGRRIDESSPMVDARLKDGSRVNAVIPPLALKGPNITIRKFMKDKLTANHLLGFGSVNQQMIDFMKLVVENKQNIIVSGGTGSGKTTLLNICSNFIPDSERIVTVEDAAELKLYQPNLISLEARPPNQEGKGAIPIRELVKNCLRMRPDRIIVGECRGSEALDMLQAMNTGHDGSLTTAHANSPRDCISRIEVMVMMAGLELPILAIREQISSAVQIIIQQTRFSCGSRKITSICEVSGMENGTVQLGEIFRFEQTGRDENGKVTGEFVATGLIPQVCEDLRNQGREVDLSVFQNKQTLAEDAMARETF